MSEKGYSGVENLEALQEAVRYNRFLVDAVESAGGGAAAAVDFGAGLGTFATALRVRGCVVRCVEPDATLATRLRGQGFEVHEDLGGLPDGSVDYIYSLNVLEHIEDDAAALQQLYRKLGPGGRCFLFVPAFGVLYSSMDERVGHFRRYRKSGLAGLARKAGFQVTSAEYVDSLGFAAALLYRLVGSRSGSLSPRSVRVYDRFVFPLSRTLDRAGVSRVAGKNLMLLLTRSA